MEAGSGLYTPRDSEYWHRYPPEIRQVIYATNAIESVNMSLRKITKSRFLSPAMRYC